MLNSFCGTLEEAMVCVEQLLWYIRGRNGVC